jgi:excinuclease UvrABC nuclease subunit
MTTWNGTSGFQFNRATIAASAPEASGVYALFNEGIWLYIGEAQNIKERLLQHLTNSHNTDVTKSNPQWFAYELVAPVYRVARQDSLIGACRPSCNKRLG